MKNGTFGAGLAQLILGLLLVVCPFLGGLSRGLWIALALALFALIQGAAWFVSRREKKGEVLHGVGCVVAALLALILFLPGTDGVVSTLTALFLACLTVVQLVTWLTHGSQKKLMFLFGALGTMAAALLTSLASLKNWSYVFLGLGLMWAGLCTLLAQESKKVSME